MDKDSLSQDEIDALLNAMASERASSPQDAAGSPKPFLLQSEIDALLSAVSSAGIPAADTGETLSGTNVISSRHRNSKAEKYDFATPGRMSRDQLKSFRALHNNYARSLSSSLSTALRTVVEVECIHIEQLTYGEYLSSLLDPSCIGVFNMRPLKGLSIIEMNPPLVFPMIDRLLGGSGSPGFYNRTFTAIEDAIIRKVMEKMLPTLQEAWKRSVKLEIRLERLENDPQFIQAAASGDPVILILFDVRFNEVKSMMSLCFPFLVIQQALSGLRREAFPALVDDQDMESYRRIMRTHLLNLNVSVSAQYEASRVTLGDLLDLKKGDIIKLQSADKDEALVFIAGQRKFYARPGVANGRKAVQIYKKKKKLLKTFLTEVKD